MRGRLGIPVRAEIESCPPFRALVTTPLAGEIAQLSEDQRRRLVEATEQRIGSGPIDSQLESNVALARRA